MKVCGVAMPPQTKNPRYGPDYATTISWIRAKVSFAILRSALLCLRGTRRKRRAANISDIDITSESAQARIKVVIFK